MGHKIDHFLLLMVVLMTVSTFQIKFETKIGIVDILHIKMLKCCRCFNQDMVIFTARFVCAKSYRFRCSQMYLVKVKTNAKETAAWLVFTN